MKTIKQKLKFIIDNRDKLDSKKYSIHYNPNKDKPKDEYFLVRKGMWFDKDGNGLEGSFANMEVNFIFIDRKLWQYNLCNYCTENEDYNDYSLTKFMDHLIETIKK